MNLCRFVAPDGMSLPVRRTYRVSGEFRPNDPITDIKFGQLEEIRVPAVPGLAREITFQGLDA
jgi:hypothetical protein